jgi:DNA mismatch repair protein MutS
MNLHNNALEQLNVFSSIEKKSQIYKYNSLYDVINKNSTKLGMRLLKKMLAEPSTNINELNERYTIVENLIKYDNNTSKVREYTYKKYEDELKNIIDIEKYHKSLGIKKLHPYQYGRLNNSYKSLLKLINLSKSNFKNYYDYNILDEYKNYYEEYKKYFNVENLEVYSFSNKNNIILNIFNNNVISEVDETYNTIQSEKNKLEELVNNLSKLIDDTSKSSNIKVKNNDINGYFLELTKIRATKLKKLIDSENIYQDLLFENKIKSSTYITSKFIKDISKNIIINENKLYDIMKESYYNVTEMLYKKYYKLFVYLNYFVSHLDVYTSFAKVSIKNNYTKPIINKESNKQQNINNSKLTGRNFKIIVLS